MDVDVRIAVGLRYLLVVNFTEPVVGSHGTGVAENQPSHGIGNRGILLHTPVLHLHIAVHHVLVIQDRAVHVPYLFPLLSI